MSEGEKRTRLQEWSMYTVSLECLYLIIVCLIPNGAGRMVKWFPVVSFLA